MTIKKKPAARITSISAVVTPCQACGKAKGTNFRCPTCKRHTLAHGIQTRFGERVRQLRESANMTQEEMSTKFGMDRSYLSEIESGKAVIRLPMIEVVALGLRISLSTLFRGL